MWVIKKKFLQLAKPVSLKHARTPTAGTVAQRPNDNIVLSGPLSQRPPSGRRLDARTLLLEVSLSM